MFSRQLLKAKACQLVTATALNHSYKFWKHLSPIASQWQCPVPVFLPFRYRFLSSPIRPSTLVRSVVSIKWYGTLRPSSDSENAVETIDTEEFSWLTPEIPFPSLTPIQQLAIPVVAKRQNVILAARTGEGKTLAYLLPVAHLLHEDEHNAQFKPRLQRPRAIILVPSRDLAHQVLKVAKSISYSCKFSSLKLTASESMKQQIKKLSSLPYDMIIGTPGRMKELYDKGALFFTEVKYLVIDEADTMFGKGFAEEVSGLLNPLFMAMKNKQRQVQVTVASATLTQPLLERIKAHFPDVEPITAPALHRTVDGVQFSWIDCRGKDKIESLIKWVGSLKNKTGFLDNKVMIFCNTLPSCRAVEHNLVETGFPACNYHGEMPRKMREQAYQDFINGDKHILVCTDIASRGLDTTMVKHVVMFDFPLNVIDFIHRAGRTARAGRTGKVTSFLMKRDLVLAKSIQSAMSRGLSLEDCTSSKKLLWQQMQMRKQEVLRKGNRSAWWQRKQARSKMMSNRGFPRLVAAKKLKHKLQS